MRKLIGYIVDWLSRFHSTKKPSAYHNCLALHIRTAEPRSALDERL